VAIRLRSWATPADTTAVQHLARRLWPLGPHPGGLGWEAATGQLPTATVLAEADGLVGWAGVTSGQLVVHADPACPQVTRLLVEWALEIAGSHDLTVGVFDGDDTLRSVLVDAGFLLGADDERLVGMFRPATALTPPPPSGYRIRSVRDDEIPARVAVHRAAWHPATLPWAPGTTVNVSAEATSTFTLADFERVRRTWLYDLELDLVVETSDGELVACCTVWWDATIRCAEIEPLGVIPQHRRRGLASALCLAANALIAARGGNRVFINTGPRDDYPAPAATYATVGFATIPRGHLYRRPKP
jgi:GNAT superfamily N-acetyltransferase